MISTFLWLVIELLSLLFCCDGINKIIINNKDKIIIRYTNYYLMSFEYTQYLYFVKNMIWYPMYDSNMLESSPPAGHFTLDYSSLPKNSTICQPVNVQNIDFTNSSIFFLLTFSPLEILILAIRYFNYFSNLLISR